MNETDNLPDLREQAEWMAERDLRRAVEALIDLDYSYSAILELVTAATQDH